MVNFFGTDEIINNLNGGISEQSNSKEICHKMLNAFIFNNKISWKNVM